MLVKDWQALLTKLGLLQNDVDVIDKDHSGCEEKARQALIRWRRKKASSATLDRLLTALNDIGRRDVSEFLKSKHKLFSVLSCTEYGGQQRQITTKVHDWLQNFAKDEGTWLYWIPYPIKWAIKNFSNGTWHPVWVLCLNGAEGPHSILTHRSFFIQIPSITISVEWPTR